MNLIGKIERERMVRRAQKKVDKERAQKILEKRRDAEFQRDLKESAGMDLNDLEGLV